MRLAFRQAAGDITRRKPQPPPRRKRSAIGDELWRWHHRKVFVHQFREIVVRRSPPPPRERRLTMAHYNYSERYVRAPLGLAAVKHMQAQEARERVVDEARCNAGLLVRARRRSLVENDVTKIEWPNRHQLRLRFSAELRGQHKSLAEVCAWHLANGTLDQFLRSIKYG